MATEQKDATSPDLAGTAEHSAMVSEQTMDFRSGAAAESGAAPAAPRPVAAPPAAFGRYLVRRVLGTGGFATVYLGHDTQLDRAVAVKVLCGGPDLPAAEVERFLQEARRLARLSHPGIVTVHDVGVHEGHIYLVSDFLDGPSLAEWLKSNRPGWPEAARVVAAVADALAHAHARSIIHRDVKPANILLTAERAPVLVDFGLGLDEAQAGGRMLGVISGSPGYMSPEQVAGTAHRIDGRTDIYSLGVVLYEMLCDCLPHRSNNVLELMRQVRDDEPQPPRQLVPDIPRELERACLKALSKRPQDRYTTAADFADDLRRVAQDAAAPATLSFSRTFPSATPPSESRVTPATSSQSRVQTPPSQRRAREAERRQVTVLAGGWTLFQSEEFLETTDAEDQARVLTAFRQACDQVVRRFEGTVVQCNAEGLLVCFGYPVAHEDAAGRAARTGLELLAALNSLAQALHCGDQPELKPWIGIHTGPAVVEVGEESVSLVGEARNVAVRLEDVAEPGQVVCSAATHRLLQGYFDCTGLGSRKLKGVSKPVELFLVQGVGEARDRVEVAELAGLTPLTGRDHEVSLLKDRWEQAQEGMGQVVLIVGEPGLGKSRLVHTIKQHVLGQMVEGEVDAPVIEWRCSPHFQDTGLYPAIDFYERALGCGREEPTQARFERLLHRLEKYGLARPETVPLWAALLSLPTPDRFPAPALSPVRQREETFRAMLEWLHTRAARRPVLFVVEDLHWVDASTLEFLGLFLAEGLHDRILTVLTFRPEFQTPWTAVAHQTSLALNRLTRRQAAELMRQKTGAVVPDALVEQVYDRTSGVPLFVEEFTRMVQESGTLGQAGEVSTSTQALLARAIPATLQDLVMARLDRLEGDRDVVQLAAALGREFSYELLAAVAAVEEPTLLAELAKLVQAEVLYAKGRPPRCQYTFKHALIEDAAYNSLVKAKRQQFHQRIAEALEARFPQTVETQPELLAHHFTEAGLAEKSVDYWLKAGRRARARSADREAIGHLTKGLAVLETLKESRERDERELKLLTTLGPAYIAARGYAAPEVGPILLRAGELCRQIGDDRQLLGIMLGMWEWHIVRGDLRLCVGRAAEGMALAERLNDPGVWMEALFMPGVTKFYRGEFAGARACYEKAIASYDDRERTKSWSAYSGHDAGVTHRCYLALTLWHLGYADQALRVDRETRALAPTIGHAFSLEHAVDFSACLHQFCRLGAEAQAAGEEEIAIATEQGFPLWHACGTLHKAAGMLLQGRREEALPLLVKGLNAFRATGAGVRVPYYLGILGDAYAQAGRFADALQAFNEALAITEKNDDRFQEAELHRLKGELLLAESPDQAAAAEGCFRDALATAQRQQSKAWELRAATSLARLWQRQGRRDEARAALAPLYNTFTEGFTTPDLVDAKALLESLA
jgi:serine/threonine protein kinase/predicted ATPase